jgi:hypothetical protein
MSDAKPRRPGRDSTHYLPAAEQPLAIGAAAPAVTEAPRAALEPSAAALEMAELPPPVQPALAPLQPLTAAVPDDAWTALAAAQGALVRACEEMTAEVGGITRSGLAAGTDAALALLGARTFAEAIEINAGMARRGFDAMVEGSTRLSEIGVKAMTEASRLILARLTSAWHVAGPG